MKTNQNERLDNPELRSLVASALAEPQLSSGQAEAIVDRATHIAGAHLSVDEEDSLEQLRDGLERRGLLGPPHSSRIEGLIAGERILRQQFVEEEARRGGRLGSWAAKLGVTMGSAFLVGLALTPGPGTVAATCAVGLYVSGVLTAALGAGLPAIGRAEGARFGVNSQEGRLEPRLPKESVRRSL